jgi:hypothetical protein
MVLGTSKPLSEEGTETRRSLSRPAPQGLEPLHHPRREGHVSRLRSRRPARLALEETKPGRGFALTGMVMAWMVLAIGIVIAVVGTVQAMRSGGAVPTPPPADTQALTRQIEELKIELDRERSEKQDLLQRLAAAQPPPAPPSEAASSVAKSEVSETNVADEGALSEPSPVEPPADIVAAVPAVPPSGPAASASKAPQAQAPATPLPTAMAPSAELLQQEAPAVAEADPSAAASGFGVHLASFADRVMAERGWALLQRNHPAALGDLTARIESTKDDAGNPIYLLVAGPFETRELAAAHCRNIRAQVVFCKPRAFIGDAPTAVQ